MRLACISSLFVMADSAGFCCYWPTYPTDCDSCQEKHPEVEQGDCKPEDDNTWCPGDSPSPSPSPKPSPTPSPTPSAEYPADKIQFIGRWYSDGSDISSTSYGHSLTIRFTGSSQVGITLSSGSQVESGKIYYQVTVDGAEATKVKHKGSKATLQLASELDPTKKHTLKLSRCSEAAYGETTIHDLVLDKGFTAFSPPSISGLRYEAVGDSITAGWNDLLSPGDDDGGSKGEDVLKTYEYHLAQGWGTNDWRAVARAGIGAVEVDGALGMEAEYLCSTFHEGSSCSRPWDFTTWQADVVTVNLGTNDYSATKTEPSKKNFKGAYSSLLSTIRDKYPKATMFAIRPMQYACPDWAAYSDNPEKWERMSTYMKDIVDAMDSNVHFIETGTQSKPWLDCEKDFVDGTHPTAAGHKKFAKLLQSALEPYMPSATVLA